MFAYQTALRAIHFLFKRLAAIPKNVRWKPAPSALSRTDRGSLRLNKIRFPYGLKSSITLCNPALCILCHKPQPLLRFSVAKIIHICSARANRMKLSSSAPTCKVSQERICFDFNFIRIILLLYVTFGDCNRIVIPIEHHKTRFIRNFIF